MKTIFIAMLSFFAFSTFAQPDCKPYVPYEVGAKWELTSYSPKGKEEGKIAYELIDKIERDNGYTYTIKSTSFDKKGKEVFTNEFNAYCKDGKFEFDMAMKMDNAAMQSYQNMEMEMDASEFELPSMDAEVGTTLKDGTLEVKVGSNSISMFTMTVLITDRKVEAKEEIETPAGTFNCLVLTQKSTTKMLVKVEASSKEWYSEGVGLVRSEYYNKKGKLNGYSELTKFEKR